jgi:hypothetical protein
MSEGDNQEYDWDEIGAAFGAWLHDQPGRVSLTPSEYLKAVQDLFEAMGHTLPDRNTAAPWGR